MSRIYHILGADIPHHNRTLLHFFQQELADELNHSDHYFYVVSPSPLTFPKLNLRHFATRKALAQAVISVAERDKQAIFILHGQFNLWIWLALFCGKLPACRVIWHIWGADLYEEAKGWKAKLFYAFRRRVQRKLPQVWATQGDLRHFWQTVRPQSRQDCQLYFPTKLPPAPVIAPTRSATLTVLLGNSGDRSNNHIPALDQLKQQLGENIRIIVPMGYPSHNAPYIQQVAQHAKRLFPAQNVQILHNKLDFTDYLHLLSTCDLGYFNVERQQAIGTICLLIQQNIPCALPPKNPFCLDLSASKVPFLLNNAVNLENIAHCRHALSRLDKQSLPFFPMNYKKGWLECLRVLLQQTKCPNMTRT